MTLTPHRSRPEPRYIVVEGPLGVGKTALARSLGERFGARLVLEQDLGGGEADNPFLEPFYRDPRRHAFAAQIYFLLSRYQQRGDLHQPDLFQGGALVTDFLFDRDRIFAQLNLSRDELSLYDKLYAMLRREVVQPDLVVYLQASADVLHERQRRRGRGPAPTRAYVEEVARAYADFFFHYSESPLLVVNTSEIDFVESRADLDDLVAVIGRTRAGVSHYKPLGTRA